MVKHTKQSEEIKTQNCYELSRADLHEDTVGQNRLRQAGRAISFAEIENAPCIRSFQSLFFLSNSFMWPNLITDQKEENMDMVASANQSFREQPRPAGQN